MEKDITLLDVAQMAEKIKSTVGTVYAWVSSRKIPEWCIIKTGRSLRFDSAAVSRWLNSLRVQPMPITS